MGRYKILEAIGEGSFGKVFRGECRDTQQIVALKFIPKHLKGDNELISLRRECEIQRGLFHPNIVLMLDSFETEREVVAVSEYVPQQLCALLQTSGAMAETVVCSVACNLVSALYYLHSHRIVHRDIKPQNILLTETGMAKLCDFGFSKKMEINTYVLESIKGTPLYMAPELIEQQPYDQKADLWSLGCILYELLTGKPPFCTNSIVHLIEMVRTKQVQWPTGCSTPCISFLQGLLQKDQDKRMEWPDVLQHPWVSEGITVVPHNPRICTLTSPLTHSQQQVKEHQKQQLVMRNMGQPNLLPRALARKYYNDTRVVPEVDATRQEAGHQTSEATMKLPQTRNICSSLEKMSLSNGTNSAMNMTEAQEHLGQCDMDSRPAVPAAWSQHDVRQVNIVEAFATADATSSRADKAEDADDGNQAVSSDNRKNNTSNLLPNSHASSRRDSPASNSNLADITPSLHHDRMNCPPLSPFKFESQGGVAEESEIQEEEWIHFLNQTMADVMGGNLDVYTQPGELAMFVAPLRNKTCPLPVAEKIAVLFMLPFVLKPGEEVLSRICESYLQHKVVCNLIFACKHVRKKPCAILPLTPSHNSGVADLDRLELAALNQALLVICHLVHMEPQSVGTRFLSQLCEAVCVLHCEAILGETLLCSTSSSQLLANVLAILAQMLRCEDAAPSGVDLANVVMTVIASAAPATSTKSGGITWGEEAAEAEDMDNALRFLLMSLLTHTAHLVRSRTSTLLAHLTGRRGAAVGRALHSQHKLLCDLINLENDSNEDVCRAASFALSRLQQHTALLKH